MTEETRKPTMRIVLTIYDRDVVVDGEHLELLRNSIIFNIDKQIKRAAKKAKRAVIRQQRIDSGVDKNVTDAKELIVDEVHKVDITKTESPKTVTDVLANLGIKLK